MPCSYGEPDPEDCAIVHWCKKLHAERSPGTKEWRAPCPVKKCPTTDDRLLVFGVWGKSVRVRNSFCPYHDIDAMRARVREVVGECAPGSAAGPGPIDRDTLIDLVFSDLPPMSLKLAVLQIAGMGTQEALDKLGVRPDHRSRVITGRTGGAPKRARNRR